MSTQNSALTLWKLCQALGWQGGTIHQVNEELFRRLGIPVDALTLTPAQVDDFVAQLGPRKPDYCICGDCGKTFRRGTEGDNEKFCLRCEHLSMRKINEDYEGE